MPPLERAKLALDEVPLLRLVPPQPTTVLETEALSPTERQSLAELRGVTDELLRKYGLDPGLLSSYMTAMPLDPEESAPEPAAAPETEKQRMLRRALDDVAAGKAVIIKGSFWPKRPRVRAGTHTQTIQLSLKQLLAPIFAVLISLSYFTLFARHCPITESLRIV